jgi:hypothetical protein
MADTLTLAQLQTELALVNSQIEAILQGKRVDRLRVGSSSFNRDYTFTGVTLTDCQEYRKYLIQEIHDKSVEAPTFRTNATIPNIVRKQIQGC